MNLLKKIFIFCLYVLPIGVVLFGFPSVISFPEINFQADFIEDFSKFNYWIIFMSLIYLPFSEYVVFYKKQHDENRGTKRKLKSIIFLVFRNLIAAFLGELLVVTVLFFAKPFDPKTGVYSAKWLLGIISVYFLWISVMIQILFEPIPKIIKRYITGNEQFIGLFLRTFNIFFIYFFALVSALFTLHNDWLNIFYCVVFNLSTIGVFWKLNKKQTQ